MCEDSRPLELLALLGDEHVQIVLSAASERPRSADELSDACGVSLPTVYRRIEAMVTHDLLTERNEIDSDGNHYKTYEAALERATVRLDDGEFVVDVDTVEQDDAPDRFMQMWSDIREDDS
ncbi:ArsR/SmtB family transcription factor [Halomicrococcus sp. NG-SE-24]|uniref:ArsR/SmtB family transcription factor n=1 Tax=Halomicrococcus sp. NG-SE-24 TaxID=3436928 RepID=UPI003D968E7D